MKKSSKMIFLFHKIPDKKITHVNERKSLTKALKSEVGEVDDGTSRLSIV